MAPPNSLCLTRGVWSTCEHERFLEAVVIYPRGPWTLITAHVGTRSAKQVQTHAQKYQHKLMRHQRGLRKWKTKSKRPEHRVDTATVDHIMNTKHWIIAQPKRTHETARSAWSVSEETVSEFSEDSDCSPQSELDAMVEAVEPVPFQSTHCASSSSICVRDECVLDDHDLLQTFVAIMNWSPSTGTITV